MKRINILIGILTGFTIVVLLYFYKNLPEVVPRQWGMDGEPTSYMTKNWLFPLTLLPVILLVLFNVVPRIDPRKENYKKHKTSYEIIVLVTSLFILAIINLTILKSSGLDIDMNIFIPMGVGILFLIIGNLMPRFRHNYFVGIRLPWTLASESVWRKVHREGGYIFIGLGLILILSGFLPAGISLIITPSSVVLAVMWLVIRSYVIFRKENR